MKSSPVFKIWFAETKIRPGGKMCVPRQDSLEKQIREMLEWHQADNNLPKGNETK
jgi:hypothetical protein